jgi:hypothetical protein
MWISRKLGIYLKTWKSVGTGPIVGKTTWTNKALKGTSFYQRPEWTINFWLGCRMFCISRNCA